MSESRAMRRVRISQQREELSKSSEEEEEEEGAGDRPVKRRRKRSKGGEETSLFSRSNWGVYFIGGLILVTGFMLWYDPEFRVFLFGGSTRKVSDNYGLKWWQTTIVYQIYPRSFQDSDGDGVGDIQGIISRLDYFEYIGVEALWLSPFYPSPMVDFGYDIADFKGVDPLFGTTADMDQLIRAARKKDIKIIVDFVPNHTSDQHPWFLESKKAEKNNFTDWYVWHPGKLQEDGTRVPPNNWVSVFGGSMWTWVEERQEFYLHQFTKEQPDLNFRNHKVHKEMQNVLFYWLKRGVDGFRVDAVRHMYEDPDLEKDEPLSHKPGTTPDQYEHYLHPYTTNQAEVHAVLRRWRNMFKTYDKRYKKEYKKDFLMVVEVYPDESGSTQQMPYYHSGADMPFNFNLLNATRTCNSPCVAHLVSSWIDNMPKGKQYWPNWVVGNHDSKRIADKIGSDKIDVYNMLLLLLPGTPTTYYGEELGMGGIFVSYEDTQDPHGKNFGPGRYHEFSRDPSRSPMQWSSEQNAGFTSGKTTWLPVHKDFKDINVEAQKDEPRSHLNIYRRLAMMRKERPFLLGNTKYDVIDDNVYAFSRTYNSTTYIVAMNFGEGSSTFDLTASSAIADALGTKRRGYISLNTLAEVTETSEGQVIALKDISLVAGQGIVIKTMSDDNKQ